jgi:hypothetical protein
MIHFDHILWRLKKLLVDRYDRAIALTCETRLPDGTRAVECYNAKGRKIRAVDRAIRSGRVDLTLGATEPRKPNSMRTPDG